MKWEMWLLNFHFLQELFQRFGRQIKDIKKLICPIILVTIKLYDAGHIDEDGYVWIMSRTDDIINVAGHRLSTGAMEEVLAEHKDVAECAVLGIADKLKGQLPIGLLTLKAGVTKKHEDISKECVQMIREKVGPVAAFKTAIVIKRLT